MAQDQGLPQVEETVRMLRELRARLPATRTLSPADLQATNITTVRIEAARPQPPAAPPMSMLDEELLILSDTSGLDELPDEGTVPGAAGPLPEWDAEPTFADAPRLAAVEPDSVAEAPPVPAKAVVEFEVDATDMPNTPDSEASLSDGRVNATQAAPPVVMATESHIERLSSTNMTAAALVRSPLRPDGNPWLTRERFLLVNWERQKEVAEEEWDEREATLRERFLAVNWERSPLHERRAAPAPSVPAQPVGTVGGFFSEVDW